MVSHHVHGLTKGVKTPKLHGTCQLIPYVVQIGEVILGKVYTNDRAPVEGPIYGMYICFL